MRKMILAFGMAFLLLMFSPVLFAQVSTVNSNFQCQINLYKAPDWGAYDVLIYMVDFNQKVVGLYNLKNVTQTQPSINHIQEPFDCEKYQRFSFRASIYPLIWKSQRNVLYNSRLIYDISSQVLAPHPPNSKLVITIHFPEDFANVPGIID